LRVAITLLFAIGLVTIIAAWWVLTSTWAVWGDQLAALANVFAAGAFVLALFAGAVATFAYGVSIEQPDLWAAERIPNSDINVPVLVIGPSQKVGGEVPAHVIVNNGQMDWQIQIENRGAYTIAVSGRLCRCDAIDVWYSYVDQSSSENGAC